MDMTTSTIAATIAAEHCLIPLSKLRHSESNVRKNGKKPGKKPKAGGMTIKALAASIFHLGVIQNLVVTAGDDDVFFVEAGDRRLQGLELLLKERKIGPEYPVRCLIVPVGAAVSVSLAENFHHEQMHPADEFFAFKSLVDEGESIEAVAAQFGLVPLAVQRRLKLANVSPRLMKAFRIDEVTIDQMMALAITDDHKAQDAAFFNAPEWQRDPRELRARLTEQEIELSRDTVAKFVGIAAYRAAGGVVRADLFAEEGQGIYLCDRELLERLAIEKLAGAVERVKAEGWFWTEAATRTTSSDFYDWQRVPQTRRKPTEAEAKQVAKLQKKLQQLRTKLDDTDDIEAEDELREQLDPLEIELEDLQASFCAYAKKYLDVAGAVVTLDNQGKVIVQRGLVRDEDTKRLRALEKPKKGGKAAAEEPAKPSMSEVLTRRLSAHRTLALQAELARQPSVALVAVVHTLAMKVLGDCYHVDSAVKIGCTVQTTLDRWAPETVTSPAAAALADARQAWIDRLPKDEGGDLDGDKLFGALRALAQDELLSLLAVCAACCVDAVTQRESDSTAHPLALALDLDMAQWWTATADGYFNHVSKARTIEAVGGFAGDQVQALGGMKKAELAGAAERLAAGTRWLPPILRRPE